MSTSLSISFGQCSDKGRKAINQDCYGVHIPNEPILTSKGIAVALADGISSSNVSQDASKAAINSFFSDYFCTSEAWSVKTSGLRVLQAVNSWLHSQTYRSEYRYDKDRGYVCTFSGVIFKSSTAHLFHVGDSRIYRLQKNALEPLTQDHRLKVSEEQSYLSRALGMDKQLDMEYRALAVEENDILILMTDGVYEFVNDTSIINSIKDNAENLEAAAKAIVNAALLNGSHDNLTIQIIRVDSLPAQTASEAVQRLTELPFPPMLEPRMVFDGYRIVRQLYASARSHVFLAVDAETDEQVVLKTPSIELRDNAAHLERFLLEEWIARRINSAHVLKPCQQNRKRSYFYITTEFVEGQTLRQWMRDHPNPDIAIVRPIIEQIAKGLRAFHRLEMLHQDIRPENIMIDQTGTIKIIDFGSTSVAGLDEQGGSLQNFHILGTAQYTAPEYFMGELGTELSDQFALGVIAYEMLSGRLPYGAEVARTTSRAAQRKLTYRSLLHDDNAIPVWVDGAIKRAVNPNPYKRYEALSEFIYDLNHPNKLYVNKARPPLLERNPVMFWQGVAFLLTMIIIFLLMRG